MPLIGPRNPDQGPRQLQRVPSSLFGTLGASGPAPQEGQREPQGGPRGAQDSPQRAQDRVQKAIERVDRTSSDEKAKMCFPPRREHDF